MTTYATDDWLNIVEEHVKEALQADAKLGTGGDLEIKTWEEEHRQDLGTYEEHFLPACSIEVTIGAPATDPTMGQDEFAFGASLLVVVGGSSGGAKLSQVKKNAKHYGARVLRTLMQQQQSGKQLADLPADLSEGEVGAVRVAVQSVEPFAGTSERNQSVLRGWVEILALVFVTFNVPED